MANWDSASFRFDPAGNERAPKHGRSEHTRNAPAEPEVGGKWHPRTTLLFILVSCGLLWAAIFASVYSLL